MSSWTHIMGTIKVCPLGRTQEEMEYILKTVLNHLPKVTGSERDMNVHIVRADGYSMSSSDNEFGEPIPMEMQDNYFLLVEGNFRDRKLDETYREFQKWLCRLSKRVLVYDVFVKINDYYGYKTITNQNEYYTDMFEYPSWSKNKNFDCTEMNWCEYLMWKKMDDCEFPSILGYKYIDSPSNDLRVERYLGLNLL